MCKPDAALALAVQETGRTDQIKQMVQPLLQWYACNARTLPWRENRQPYPVWVSEIMLQQTRVEAVKPYFLRFMEALPTLQDLACAPQERLYKLWEGLGYYTRVRNLQKAAKMIVAQYGGVFPQSYEQIRSLPGIGEYTAGAICSICFAMPVAAVDGNVLRVLARYTCDDRDISAQSIKKQVKAELEQVYPRDACGAFTQSLMELGATVCVPKQPLCGTCPLEKNCAGKACGRQQQLPVKAPKKQRRVEDVTVFLLRSGNAVALQKREEPGVLQGMWAFPHVQQAMQVQEALEFAARQGIAVEEVLGTSCRRHVFTHVQWNMQAYLLRCAAQQGPYVWMDILKLKQEIALPTAFRQFLDFLPLV